jgi:hypothetical protein
MASTEHAVAAAVAVAREHGLATGDPRVLRDLTNVIVHLAPAPVVARVQLTLAGVRGRDWARAEMDAALFLASAGAPIAPPITEVDPGPHEHDGLLVTFWRWIDHDPARADAHAAGRALRDLHNAFAGYDGNLPTCDRLEEVRRLLAAAPPSPELDELRALTDRLPPLSGAPIHGDAHLRNVLWSPAGPLWTDLENVCRGPREYDLACIRFRTLPENDEAFAGYGRYDEGVLERALMYVTLFLAAVTPLVAQRAGTDDARAEAARRIERALAYAREM